MSRQINLDHVWAAGFLDGEGYFGVKRINGYHVPKVAAGQNDRRPLDKLAELFGGTVRVMRDERPNRKQFYMWELCAAKQIAPMLDVIRPYLRVKDREAETLRALCLTIYRRKGVGKRDIPESILRERDRLEAELKKLNAKGVSVGV